MEVACNMVPFAAASNNNLNPIIENIEAELSAENGELNNSAKVVIDHESNDIQNG